MAANAHHYQFKSNVINNTNGHRTMNYELRVNFGSMVSQ